jgi:hypothetical protein
MSHRDEEGPQERESPGAEVCRGEGQGGENHQTHHSGNGGAGQGPLAALRRKLRELGYSPIPCNGKIPSLPGWPEKLAVSDEEINRWGTAYPTATNTGLLTKRTPTIDIDIRIPDAAEAVERLVSDRYADHGTILTRFGQSPKRAIPFRTDTSFFKLACKLIAPDGSDKDKIEFLANGQQFIIDGIHPDTRKPYSWHGGSPLDTKHEALPFISQADAYALFNDAIELLITEYGYKRADDQTRKTHNNGKADAGGTGSGWQWSEGFGAKKLKEYCKLVQDAAEGGHDAVCCGVFMFGRWCGGGLHDVETACEKLKEAARENNAKTKSRSYEDEVERAFRNGVKQPTGPFIEKSEKSLDEFRAFLPEHKYIYIPTRELWPGASVDSIIPSMDSGLKATMWLKQNRAVEQMTWAPGEEMLIKDRLVAEGGWFAKPGATCFNNYRRPTIVQHGDARKAKLWLDHVHKVFNDDDAEHCIKWFAHRVQRPGEKINHILVLGSDDHGIGKDAMMVPVSEAIGPWNYDCINPKQAMGDFNPFFKRVMLVICEAKDLGDVNRYQFYDHLKGYAATPPDVIKINEKHVSQYNIFNCVGFVITTNYKTNGIYLPPQDRRHYVAWSDRVRGDFEDGYWPKLFNWYHNEDGCRHVAAYLQEYDLSRFNPKEPPPQTEAFWDIVDANRTGQDAELADILDGFGNPGAITIRDILEIARDSESGKRLAEWLDEPKNQRIVPMKMRDCEYEVIKKPGRKDGFWIVNGKRRVVYAKMSLTAGQQLEAAEIRANGPDVLQTMAQMAAAIKKEREKEETARKMKEGKSWKGDGDGGTPAWKDPRDKGDDLL